MDGALLTLIVSLVGLVVFDLLALRFGADSRRLSGTHRDW
jgi:hypothetical protein